MRKLIYLSLPLIISIILTEFTLRQTKYRALLARTPVHLEHDPKKQFYTSNPTLGFSIRPNTTGAIRSFPYDGISYTPVSNEIGCYDWALGDVDIKSSGLAIGDSFTFGVHELGHGWPSILERLSQERILKCGVDSYGTKQELEWTKLLLSKLNEKPKFILLQYYTGNDMFDDYLHPAVISLHGQKVSRFDLSKTNFSTGETVARQQNEYSKLFESEIDDQPSIYAQNSVLLALLEGLISKKGISSIQIPTITSSSHSPSFLTYDEVNRPWLASAWKKHLDVLLEFKVLCDFYNIPFYVLLFPTNDQVYPFLIPSEEHSFTDLLQPNRKVSNFLLKNEIQYFDILDHLRNLANQESRPMLDPNNDFYNKVDGHFSFLGEEYVGILVAKYLAEQGLFLDSKDKLIGINEQLQQIESKLKKNKPKLLYNQAPKIISFGPSQIKANSENKKKSFVFWLKLNELKDSYILDTSLGKFTVVKDYDQSIITFEIPFETLNMHQNIEVKIYDRVKGLFSSSISIPILY